MAENSTPEDRTEDPTERRMAEIRREGMLFVSSEVVQLSSLVVGFLAVRTAVPGLVADLKRLFVAAFTLAGTREPMTVPGVRRGALSVVLLLGPEVCLIVLLTAAAGSLAVMLQTKWNVRPQWISFRFSFLNPVAGLRRIVSVSGVVNTVKAIAKLSLLLPVAYFALLAAAPSFLRLPFVELEDVYAFCGRAMDRIFWKLVMVLAVVAAVDFFYGRFRWLRDNRMTKEEVKDERKAVEGDETMRRRMIAKGLQRAARRIAVSVPKADVVVTNPTHFAVALKYDRTRGGAPVVVAKGQDHLAFRIREIAAEHGVPVLERKALARALYASTEVGSEIPSELFRAVAEVLAHVYRLKRPGRPRQDAGGGV